MVWGFLPNWTPRLLWHKFWTRSPGSSEPKISGIVSAAKPFYHSPVFTLNVATKRGQEISVCSIIKLHGFFLFSKQLCWHRNRPISQPLVKWRLVFYTQKMILWMLTFLPHKNWLPRMSFANYLLLMIFLKVIKKK